MKPYLPTDFIQKRHIQFLRNYPKKLAGIK